MLILLMLLMQGFAAENSNCQSREFYQEYISDVKKNSEIRDEYIRINTIRSKFRPCLEKLGMYSKQAEQNLRKWEDQGSMTEIGSILNKIAHKKAYGMDTTEEEIDIKTIVKRYPKMNTDTFWQAAIEEKKKIRPVVNNKEHCAPQNLSNKIKTTQNQAGRGWCTAFALAHYLEIITGKSYSANEIFLSYARDERQNTAAKRFFYDEKMPFNEEGSRTEDVFASVKKNGLCPTEDFNTAITACDKSSIIPVDIIMLGRKIGAPALSAAIKSNCSSRRAHLPKDFNLTKLELYKKTSIKDYNLDVIAMMKELDEGRPALASVVYNNMYTKFPDAGGHAILVVGKRWNPKRNICELLIKDSNAADETSHLPNAVMDGPQQFWIGEDDFTAAAGRIYIKEK